MAIQARFLVGRDALDAVTTLLQRVRNAHPTAGLFQAAEVQWWWRSPRSTDEVSQLVWFDDDGLPIAAVIATDWGDGSSLVYANTTLSVMVMPDATPEWTGEIFERALAHIAECGIETIEVEVDRNDVAMLAAVADHGFVLKGDGVVEAWLPAENRPAVSALADGYRLFGRDEVLDRPHHFSIRNGLHEEERLRETSLYRDDLDLVIYDRNDDLAAYGLFWFDPVTATGVVEPMRTIDEHQQRGLARHVLTAGVDLLVRAGATRISIGYEPDNPASGHLYRSVGFEPVLRTDLFAGKTSA